MSNKSASQSEKPAVIPFHCIDPQCSHLFGATLAHELRIGESAIVRGRAVLTCPKCGKKRSWRPHITK